MFEQIDTIWLSDIFSIKIILGETDNMIWFTSQT